MKRLGSSHPLVFFLLAAALLFDVISFATSGSLFQGASYAAGSLLAVVYFLSISSLLRFVAFHHRIHLAVTWIIIVLMYFGWFVLLAALQQDNYRPSFLLLLCVVAAFKTMRLVDDLCDESGSSNVALAPADVASANEVEAREDSSAGVTPAHALLPPEIDRPSVNADRILPETVVISQNQNDSSEVNQSPRKIECVSLKTVLACLAAAGCLLALFDLPEDFCKVLRFVVVAACVAVIWDVQKGTNSTNKKTAASIAFGLLAVVFNPILPLEMSQKTWAWFYVIGAILFLAAQKVPFSKRVTNIAIVACLVLGFVWVGWLAISAEIQARKWKATFSLPNPKGVMDNDEVDTILRELPKASPDVQAEMRNKLAAWRENVRQKEKDLLDLLFLDPETWGGQWTPKHQAMVDKTLDPMANKLGAANLKWIAAQEGRSTDEIDPFLPSYRKAYAQKFFGKPDMNDEAFYGAVKTRIESERALRGAGSNQKAISR